MTVVLNPDRGRLPRPRRRPLLMVGDPSLNLGLDRVPRRKRIVGPVFGCVDQLGHDVFEVWGQRRLAPDSFIGPMARPSIPIGCDGATRHVMFGP